MSAAGRSPIDNRCFMRSPRRRADLHGMRSSSVVVQRSTAERTVRPVNSTSSINTRVVPSSDTGNCRDRRGTSGRRPTSSRWKPTSDPTGTSKALFPSTYRPHGLISRSSDEAGGSACRAKRPNACQTVAGPALFVHFLTLPFRLHSESTSRSWRVHPAVRDHSYYPATYGDHAEAPRRNRLG